jgi:hypothetical protein
MPVGAKPANQVSTRTVIRIPVLDEIPCRQVAVRPAFPQRHDRGKAVGALFVMIHAILGASIVPRSRQFVAGLQSGQAGTR